MSKDINLGIEHQPHDGDGVSVDTWLADSALSGHCEKLDWEGMVRTGNVWVVSWYSSALGEFRSVAAATLLAALSGARAESAAADWLASALVSVKPLSTGRRGWLRVILDDAGRRATQGAPWPGSEHGATHEGACQCILCGNNSAGRKQWW